MNKMLHVLGVYYGGGYMSGGSELALQVLFNTEISEEQLRNKIATANDICSNDTGTVDKIQFCSDYLREALDILSSGKNVAFVHQVSDSFYVVGNTFESVVNCVRAEFLIEEQNFNKFVTGLRNNETSFDFDEIASLITSNDIDEAIDEVCEYEHVATTSDAGIKYAERVRNFFAYIEREKIGEFAENNDE